MKEFPGHHEVDHFPCRKLYIFLLEIRRDLRAVILNTTLFNIKAHTHSFSSSKQSCANNTKQQWKPLKASYAFNKVKPCLWDCNSRVLFEFLPLCDTQAVEKNNTFSKIKPEDTFGLFLISFQDLPGDKLLYLLSFFRLNFMLNSFIRLCFLFVPPPLSVVNV